MEGWGVWSSRIVVVGLEDFRDVIGGFIRNTHNMFVGCRNVDKIFGSSIMDILTYLFQLEVHYFGLIGHKSGDKGKGHTDFV